MLRAALPFSLVGRLLLPPLPRDKLTVTAECVSGFCASCQAFGGTTFSSCCSNSKPASCFEKIYGPTLGNALTDANNARCLSAFNMIESCAMKTSSFTHLPSGSQAKCLCYSGKAYAPNIFDHYLKGCVSWASTAELDELSGFKANAGLCTSVGNILEATATVTKTGSLTKRQVEEATLLPGKVAKTPCPAVTPRD